MYVVDEATGDVPRIGRLDTPLAMTSVSQPATLEQWHRRLAHCSPLTITEMLKSHLVDGLNISDGDLCGKCEDCVVGRQTRWPFDGKTETDLDPLELVSFQSCKLDEAFKTCQLTCNSVRSRRPVCSLLTGSKPSQHIIALRAIRKVGYYLNVLMLT